MLHPGGHLTRPIKIGRAHFDPVDDVARSNVFALQSDTTDEFYNVGTGIQTTIRELCDVILDLKQSNLEVTYQPYAAADARRLVQNRIGCPKLAAEQLNFRHEISLCDGLQKLIDWRDGGN